MRPRALAIVSALALASAGCASTSPLGADGEDQRVVVVHLNGDSVLHYAVSVVAGPDGRLATNAGGRPLKRQVYTPSHHFDVVLSAALRAGDRFGTVIHYDPLGSSGVVGWWSSPRSARLVVVRGGEIAFDEWSREVDSTRSLARLFDLVGEFFGPRARVDLVYFGKSLVRPYASQANQSASVTIDESHPNAPFRLAHLRRELDRGRRRNPRLFPLQSATFLACQMSSAEALSELAPYTRNVVAPQLEISHLAWFGSFRFLDDLAHGRGPLQTEEVVSSALKVNQANGERNLELAARGWEEPAALRRRRARRRRTSGWVRVRLGRWSEWQSELATVVAFLHERYVRQGRMPELHELLERAHVRSRWPRALVSGVDVAELLREVRRLKDPPPAAKRALQLHAELVDVPGRPGLRGVSALHLARSTGEYARLAFNRNTGWHARIAAPYARWRSER